MRVMACGFNGCDKFMRADGSTSLAKDQSVPSFTAPYWENLVKTWESQYIHVVSSLEDILLLDCKNSCVASLGRMTPERSFGPARAVVRVGIFWIFCDADNTVFVSDEDGKIVRKTILSGDIGPVRKMAAPICWSDRSNQEMLSVFVLDADGQTFRLDLRDSGGKGRIWEFDDAVVDIVAGREHVLFRTRSGNVYACGLSSRGQLGLGNLNAFEMPQKIDPASFGQMVTQIAAGGWSSMALNSAGVVFVWGWNSTGALALPSRSVRERALSKQAAGDERDDFVEVQAEPVPLPLQEKIEWISCGMRHAGAVTRSGLIYVWGLNQHGQLGLGDFLDRDAPVLVDLKCVVPRTCRLFCGEWTTVLLFDESSPEEVTVPDT